MVVFFNKIIQNIEKLLTAIVQEIMLWIKAKK